MKKLLTVSAFSLLVFASMAVPPVTKYRDHRGLFGYRTVTQYNYPNSITLYCSGPGLTACRTTSGITVVGDNDEISLSESDVESVEKAIDEKIYANSNSGTLVFADKVIVTFWYNEDRDELSYTLYSKPQALRYGINY